RRVFTFLPRIWRGRTLSFWASATIERSPESLLRRPNYGSRRGGEIEHEPEWPGELAHFRACEVVKAHAPQQHALEVLDELDLFYERRGRLHVVAARVARRPVRILGRGVLEPRAEEGVAPDRDRLPAWARERARGLDGVRRHAECSRGGALAELEHEAIEAGLVRHADRHEP